MTNDTINIEEIYNKVQAHEATIQSFLGEKSAMKRQLIDEENDLNKLRTELKEKFDLNLEDLSDKVNELRDTIKTEYEKLDEKVKQLE